jgi:hypothetical protein
MPAELAGVWRRSGNDHAWATSQRPQINSVDAALHACFMNKHISGSCGVSMTIPHGAARQQRRQWRREECGGIQYTRIADHAMNSSGSDCQNARSWSTPHDLSHQVESERRNFTWNIGASVARSRTRQSLPPSEAPWRRGHRRSPPRLTAVSRPRSRLAAHRR